MIDPKMMNALLTPLASMELTGRGLIAFSDANIFFLGQALTLKKDELMLLPKFGHKAFGAFNAEVEKYGFEVGALSLFKQVLLTGMQLKNRSSSGYLRAAIESSEHFPDFLVRKTLENASYRRRETELLRDLLEPSFQKGLDSAFLKATIRQALNTPDAQAVLRAACKAHKGAADAPAVHP